MWRLMWDFLFVFFSYASEAVDRIPPGSSALTNAALNVALKKWQNHPDPRVLAYEGPGSQPAQFLYRPPLANTIYRWQIICFFKSLFKFKAITTPLKDPLKTFLNSWHKAFPRKGYWRHLGNKAQWPIPPMVDNEKEMKFVWVCGFFLSCCTTQCPQ